MSGVPKVFDQKETDIKKIAKTGEFAHAHGLGKIQPETGIKT